MRRAGMRRQRHAGSPDAGHVYGDRINWFDGPIRQDCVLPQSFQFKSAIGWIILAVLMGWRPLELAKLPTWITKLAILAGGTSLAASRLLREGASFVMHGLLTFRRWNDELKYLPKFLAIFTLAVLELLVENYFVWVVAASNVRKYDSTFVPLQDNVVNVVNHIADKLPPVYWFVHWHWAHMANFLLAFLCIPVPYSGFGIASRALMMHTVVRCVRTVAFLAVVLPNARSPLCYKRRFPPVPDAWSEYFWTGVSTLKGFGGCNDLILSGHACTWMMAVMTITTFYPHGPLKLWIWLAYIQSSVRTAVEGWHYSVDFLLPAVLSWYVWKDVEWVYSTRDTLNVQRASKDPISRTAVLVVVTVFLFCIINAFFLGA